MPKKFRRFSIRSSQRDAARLKGYEKCFSYVRADNEAALKTYLRQGFRVVGKAERQAKIDGRYIDEIVIEKTLRDLPRHEASGDPEGNNRARY